MRALLPALVLACALPLAGLAHAQPVVVAPAEPAWRLSGGANWNALNAEQRNALRPLAPLWPTLQPDHQRKWIALTRNYNRMSPDARLTLQSRMAEWARLTQNQRAQARLNYGEVRRLPADERRALWEQYQALPPEERERLARARPRPPIGAAPALRPEPPSRIVRPAVPYGRGVVVMPERFDQPGWRDRSDRMDRHGRPDRPDRPDWPRR